MYNHIRLLGERPSHGIFTGLTFSLAVIAFGWAASLSHSADNDVRTIVRQTGVMVAGAKSATQIDQPLTNREGKADKLSGTSLPFHSIDIAVRGNRIIRVDADGESYEERVFHEGERIASQK